MLVLTLAGCIAPQSSVAPRGEGQGPTTGAPAAPKVIVAAVSNEINGFAPIGLTTSTGNMVDYVEIPSNGLVTSDAAGHAIPQLASALPSLDNGSIRLLDDGRMTTVYTLRPNVTWQDGAPFTAADVAFGFKVHANPEIPFNDRTAVASMESVEAIDPATVLITWKSPSYLADSLGLGILLPLPAHILEADFSAGDMQKFQNLPYWTTAYVHAGPFRLTHFEPGAEADFQAYDGYFLGRPKVDGIIIKQLLDRNAIVAALLKGDVQLTVEMFDGDTANNLADRWAVDGGGKVYTAPGGASFIDFQFSPQYVSPQEILDPRIRRALFYSLDRRALTDLAWSGRVAPGAEALSILGTGDRLYPYVRDMYASMANDPTKAAEMFADAGWTRGPDGILVDAQGRPLEIGLQGTREAWASAAADMWKRAGVDMNLHIVTAAEARDREFQQAFPSADFGGSGAGDRIFQRIDPYGVPSKANGFAGQNRGHWSNPQMAPLVDRYRGALAEADQGSAMHDIAQLVGDDLPLLNLSYIPVFGTVRTEVHALDDMAGAQTGIGSPFGSYSRNAYLWELTG